MQHIEAKLLALQGRGGDTELAHLTPGEMIVPPQLQTPEVVRALQQAAHTAGIDMAQYTAGSQASRVNPETGLEEYRYSSQHCGDLTPMGLCLSPLEEIIATGKAGDIGSYYPGHISYPGIEITGSGTGGSGGGGVTYGPESEDDDPIEEIVVNVANPNTPSRPPWQSGPIQLVDARRYQPWNWNPYSPHLGEPDLAPPKVPWDETPEDFSKFSDSDLVLRIRRIDAKIAQNKIIERIPGGKLFG
ncbi:MAG: hypothetical protein RIB43_16705, partial [Rhodospirillaceae bacterium]